MHKKNIDECLAIEDYNKKIFNKSMELIYHCKKINTNTLTSQIKSNPKIKKIYTQLDDKLQNMLRLLRNFTQAQKPIFNNPIQLAKQILQQLKLHVQIQFRKIQQENNTVKKNKKQENKKYIKPQQLYPDIKTFDNFDQHSHQNYLQDGIIKQLIICQQIQPPNDINDKYLFIDTLEKLQQAIQQIKQCSQLAVDVQHSMKSYQGFTCLIQLSTRKKDYIVDVFPIWNHVQNLQQVIGNHKILKVMHGAEMDTKWLQRDFNIHIINLFDTHKAARVLGLLKFSYAFLLTHYFSVNTNKIYQRADWRERPLSTQMLKYARIDTHYLLAIYDSMRIDLQKQATTMNLSITQVLKDIQRSSNEVTLSNVQLFSYINKQLYINLSSQFKDKKQQFKAVEVIFSQLNYLAMRYDINFDQLIYKKNLMQIISYIKDIVFNKYSKISKQVRIQKIIKILQKQNYNNSNILTPAINNIKQQLFKIFCYKDNKDNLQKIYALTQSNNSFNSKNLQKSIMELNITCFSRQRNDNVKFWQYDQQSLLENSIKNANKVVFMPFVSYLSKKYGIEEVKQIDASQNQDSSEQVEQGEDQQMDQQPEDEEQQDGKIQFKRMNPNVIYTIEDPDAELVRAVNNPNPRKIKRQSQYENRIRNKQGNIYELLQNNQ